MLISILLVLLIVAVLFPGLLRFIILAPIIIWLALSIVNDPPPGWPWVVIGAGAVCFAVLLRVNHKNKKATKK